MGGPAVPLGSPSPLLREVPSQSRNANVLCVALGSEFSRIQLSAAAALSAGEAQAMKRDFFTVSVAWLGDAMV